MKAEVVLNIPLKQENWACLNRSVTQTPGVIMMQAVEFTLKKVFPWLASSESDFGLFLLYNAYIPNWSFCKKEVPA